MHNTPQLVIDALLASIATLPPRRIAEAEAALAMAHQRAEAVVEIDAPGSVRPCPHCAAGTGLPGDQRGRASNAGGAGIAAVPGRGGPARLLPAFTVMGW